MSTSAAKRILYVEGNVDRTIGGSYFSLFYLVAGLDRERFEPIVVFATDNSLISSFNARGVQTIVRAPAQPTILWHGGGRILAKPVNFVRGWIVEPIRIAALLHRHRISLVHLNNGIIRNDSWVIAARLAGIPCITHERGIIPHFHPRDKFLAKRLDAIICISKAVHDNLVSSGFGGPKLTTIYNGLDPTEMRVTRSALEIRRELGVQPSARLIGIVGNIKKWKGQEVVIRAMASLHNFFPEVICLLIGDTPPHDSAYRATIHDLIRDSGLTDHVLITGFRTDVADYINALEIQIHASITPEPFGRVLLEGMALGKPLVASNVGAVPEIVLDGRTGLLFDPSRVDALIKCVHELLADPIRAQMLGRNGRSRLDERFSAATNARQTEHIYDELLRG